ncbi:DMT family transporter [uncultured Kordia sp.]|uniref:DMT family transporter n=1 Tax=uncultured Kordia sp. TaxID=507699 RepID=UPI0026043458|nr:DMT family transporter [uncultured Kordia sp.]
MSKKTFAFVAAFMVQVFYGVTFTFAADVIKGGYIKPFGFILLRVAGAGILFWIFSFLGPKEKIERKDFFTFFLGAVFGIAINMLCFFKGFEYTTPIHASVIMVVVPIIVLILSAIFLKEKVISTKIIGILLGLSGAVILSIYGKPTAGSSNIPLGNLLVFINAVSYSIYIIIIKKLTYKYHPLTFIKWLFLFGTILVFPFGFSQLSTVDWSIFSPYVFFEVAFVIVGATFATYLLNPLALRELKASTVTTFLYLQPVIAGIFAVLVGSDSLDLVKIVAAILIFAGVYLVTLNKVKKRA